jgi:hypothetical protein
MARRLRVGWPTYLLGADGGNFALTGIAATLTASTAASGYDVAARVAEIRSNPDYGTFFSDTSNQFTPNGLVLPTAPQGTLTTRNVSSLADLRTYAALNGQHITLAPGTYTESGAVPPIDVYGNDLRITLTGCTINSLATQYGLRTSYQCDRVEIIDGVINSGCDVHGRDIKIKGTEFHGSEVFTSGASVSNGGGFFGERVLLEHVLGRELSNGFFFTGSARRARFAATFSGTTMTVTSVDSGSEQLVPGLRVQRIFGGGSGPHVLNGTEIVSQLTGTTGGTGTYELSASVTNATSTTCWALAQCNNMILANSDIESPNTPEGAAFAHESVTRINGTHLGIVMDSRVWSGLKLPLRAHAEYEGRWGCGTIGWFNNQAENCGCWASEHGPAAISPVVENIFVEGMRIYRPESFHTGGIGGMFDFRPYSIYSQISAVSGDGTTITATASASFEHGREVGDVIDIINGIPSSLNQTGAVVTASTPTSISWAGTLTGTLTDCDIAEPDKIVVDNAWFHDNIAYSAPHDGADGDPLFPRPVANKPARWTTVADSATALANGNVHATYVTPPAWTFA